MFADKNHLHALTTVIGTLGGFQAQPAWFAAAAKTSIWQILMAAVLVFQGGGNLDFVYSLVVATVFYIIGHLTSYIEFGPAKSVDSVAPPAEATESEVESFFARRY